MTKDIWQTYNGIDVSVNEDGQFCAEIGGVFLRDGSWERLRLKIENEKKVEAKALVLRLDCIVLTGDNDNGDYAVQQWTMTGLNRKDHSFKWSHQKNESRIIYVLPHTQKNADLLEQLAIAKSTVRDIEQAIKERILQQSRWGGRIEASKYDEELCNLRSRYQRALDAG